MYTIKPIFNGIFEKHEKSIFTYKQDMGVGIDVPIVSYLVEGEGRSVLVDSGPPNPERIKRMITRPIKQGTWIQDELKNLRVSPEKIDAIVLTHLHWDHCYNLELFPGKPIYVQRRELQYAIAPLPCDTTTYLYGGKNGLPGWFEGYLQMIPVDGDFDLFDGIRLLPLPGHTPGIQGVLVKTSEGSALIASDAFPLFENYEQGIASGLHVNVAEWYQSYEKAKKLCDFILPGHDMKVLQRRIYGE